MKTWHEILIADLAVNRAEAIDYFDMSLQEYQTDGDTLFLLKGLRNIIEALGGVSEIEKQTGKETEGLLKVLSSNDAPSLDTLNTLAKALGCRLSIEPLPAAHPDHEVKDENQLIAQRTTAHPSFEVATD